MMHIKLKVVCSYPRQAYYYILTKKCNNISKLLNAYTKGLSLLHEFESRDNLLNQHSD